MISLEYQTMENDGYQTVQESLQDDCDITMDEPAGRCCANVVDADTWVTAAEFVPGQLWQSVGKWGKSLEQ